MQLFLTVGYGVYVALFYLYSNQYVKECKRNIDLKVTFDLIRGL